MIRFLRLMALAIVSRLTVGIAHWRWRALVVDAPTETAPAVAEPIAPPPEAVCDVCRLRMATRAVAWESAAFVPPAIYSCEECVVTLHRKSEWGVA